MTNFINRDNNRRKLVSIYELKRLQYKSLIKDFSVPREIKNIYIEKLNKLPRNSSKIRIRNRCIVTGRGRSVFRFCKLSRISLRNLASQGLLPGIRKSSW
jgi:small subunit ribosomal protein S14